MFKKDIAGADAYISDAGSLIVSLGGILGEREYVGVGFIISVSARPFVLGYREYTNRLASLRIRISGGQLGIVVVYAPISVVDYDIRYSFYAELIDCYAKLKCYGPKITIGDFNARIH